MPLWPRPSRRTRAATCFFNYCSLVTHVPPCPRSDRYSNDTPVTSRRLCSNGAATSPVQQAFRRGIAFTISEPMHPDASRRHSLSPLFRDNADRIAAFLITAVSDPFKGLERDTSPIFAHDNGEGE